MGFWLVFGDAYKKALEYGKSMTGHIAALAAQMDYLKYSKLQSRHATGNDIIDFEDQNPGGGQIVIWYNSILDDKHVVIDGKIDWTYRFVNIFILFGSTKTRVNFYTGPGETLAANTNFDVYGDSYETGDVSKHYFAFFQNEEVYNDYGQDGFEPLSTPVRYFVWADKTTHKLMMKKRSPHSITDASGVMKMLILTTPQVVEPIFGIIPPPYGYGYDGYGY